MVVVGVGLGLVKHEAYCLDLDCLSIPKIGHTIIGYSIACFSASDIEMDELCIGLWYT